MTTIQQFLAHDHEHCDDLFMEAENAVLAGNWHTAYACFALFQDALRHHFLMEEQVLFPALEEEMHAKGHGSTIAMRSEHAQIFMTLTHLAKALRQNDKNIYLGHSRVLSNMLQQHNAKEESIFYPIADRLLTKKARQIVKNMNEIYDHLYAYS